MKIEFYGATDLASCQNDLELIDAMKAGLAELSTGSVIQPQWTQRPDPTRDVSLLAMPAISDVTIVKIVANYPGNHSLGLESNKRASSCLTGLLVSLLRPSTGHMSRNNLQQLYPQRQCANLHRLTQKS